jgi:2,3-diketo-5-methylthio-1-phosphopentane phosphatase
MKLAFVCDFDGTVAPDDIGAGFVRRFGTGPDDALEAALARWRRGEIGHRELTQVECGRLRVTEPEAAEWASAFALDPEFAPFARAAVTAGHRVSVASEGFDFYIAELLRRAGLEAVAYTSNRLRFDDGRAIAEFPHAGGCGRCGNCKGARVDEQRRDGYTVVMVGDGYSDRCGAKAADHVVARGDLLEWCRGGGIAVQSFEGFAGLARWMHAASPNGGSPRGASEC